MQMLNTPRFDLPPEVVLIVMEHMDDPRDVLELASTCKLYRMLLHHARVMGTVRVEDTDHAQKVMGVLRRLQGLKVESVDDISFLSNALHLRRLDLTDSQVADVSALRGLVALKELDLGGTQVSDVSGLSSLVHLQTLYLSATQVSDVSGLSSLVLLQTLDLGGTQVRDVSSLDRKINIIGVQR